MAVAFFSDTSALCKRYVAETGSSWLSGTVDPASGFEVFIVRTTPVEMISAITRRERAGSLTPADALKARTDFRAHLASDYQVIELSPTLASRAMNLAEKHVFKGFDAVQLAAALQVNALRIASGFPALTVLSSDSELNVAAAAEGLLVEDPNTHP